MRLENLGPFSTTSVLMKMGTWISTLASLPVEEEEATSTFSRAGETLCAPLALALGMAQNGTTKESFFAFALVEPG
jgi:hypothetical protein